MELTQSCCITRMSISKELFVIQWCSGGVCVNQGRTGRDMEFPGGWSPWKDQPCTSGCLEQAKGVITSHRDCDSPAPMNVMMRCRGERSKQELCDDDALCTGRTTAKDYAKNQCQEFSHIVDTIDPSGVGMQAAYSASKFTPKSSSFM